MRRLRVSPKLALPLDWMTMATVVYGARGSGKTTFGAVVAEELHKVRQRFCAIDLKGDLWGLRASADGREEGIPVVIFGGAHADVPLEEGAGKYLGELVASIEQSVVLDFENISKGKQLRFLGEFFTALYHCNRAPLLVIADEAQRYASQKPISPEASICLGAVEDLVKLGRKHGLGVMLLTQRGAGLNKEVSEICDMLVAFRTPSSIDQDRISDWLGANGFDKNAVLPRLPQFANGEAVVASAHPELKLFDTVRMRPRETFDSSATPKVVVKRREPKRLAKPELETIEQQMAEAIERARDNDPKALRQEIERLHKRVFDIPDGFVAITKEELASYKKAKTVEVPAVSDTQVKKLEAVLKRATDARQNALAEVARADAAMKSVVDDVLVALARTAQPAARTVTAIRQSAPPAPPRQIAAKRAIKTDGDASITPAKQRILDAVAWFERLGVMGPARVAVGFIAKMSAGTGNFANYLGSLRSSGLVVYPLPGYVALTDDGRAQANPLSIEPTIEALQEEVLARLQPRMANILQAAINVYPEAISREQIGEKLGMSSGTGNFANYLGSLRTLGLIDYPSPGFVAATDMLFPKGLS